VRQIDDTHEDFSAFVAATSTRLMRSAYLLTTSRAGAEDLLQTTFAKAYASWHRVKAAADPVGYVYGILYHTFISDRRRRSTHEQPVDRPPDVAVAERDPVPRLVLEDALRTLAPLDRAVLVLRFFDDLSVAETAARLRLSEAAVKTRSMRALRSLRPVLGEYRNPASKGSNG
jgi:RNA polymerase sigma-70 factor (sigma-E family)